MWRHHDDQRRPNVQLEPIRPAVPADFDNFRAGLLEMEGYEKKYTTWHALASISYLVFLEC